MKRIKQRVRTYSLRAVADGWVLKLFEDGREMGGGFGVDEDRDLLLLAAEQFCTSRHRVQDIKIER